MNSAESKKNVYDILTEKFVEALEKGTVPWQAMHSVTSQSTWPRNAVTGRPFNGVNVALLSVTRLTAGYPHNLWLTFKEAQALGGSVRKGERGTPVFFFSVFEKKDEIDPRTGLPAKRFVLRYTPRFNIAQCDGIKLPKGRIPDAPVAVVPGAELALAQKVSADYLVREGVPLTHMDTTPHYNIAADSICLPEMGRFTTPAAYYKTLFHEIAHSTGAAKRRKRPLNPHKQSEEYSYEELVAESTAAFLLAHCGVSDTALVENSAAYIAGWVQALKRDPRMIMRASSEALKIAEYVVGGKLRGMEDPTTATDDTADEIEVPTIPGTESLDTLFA